MSSTISNYFSALEKKHYDDLPDYDRGRLYGAIEAQLAFLGVNVAFMLFRVYKRNR